MSRVTATPFHDLPVAGRHLCGLAWMDGLLWYSDADTEDIVAVDPESGRATAHIPCRGVATGLTDVDGGPELIQIVGPDKRLRRIHSGSGAARAEIPNPRPGRALCGIAQRGSEIWLGYRAPGILERRSYPDLELLGSMDLDHDVADVTFVGELVAFADHTAATISVVDPASLRIDVEIDVEGGPTGLTWDGSRLWYCDYTNFLLRGVDVPVGAL